MGIEYWTQVKSTSCDWEIFSHKRVITRIIDDLPYDPCKVGSLASVPDEVQHNILKYLPVPCNHFFSWDDSIIEHLYRGKMLRLHLEGGILDDGHWNLVGTNLLSSEFRFFHIKTTFQNCPLVQKKNYPVTVRVKKRMKIISFLSNNRVLTMTEHPMKFCSSPSGPVFSTQEGFLISFMPHTSRMVIKKIFVLI